MSSLAFDRVSHRSPDLLTGTGCDEMASDWLLEVSLRLDCLSLIAQIEYAVKETGIELDSDEAAIVNDIRASLRVGR